MGTVEWWGEKRTESQVKLGSWWSTLFLETETQTFRVFFFLNILFSLLMLSISPFN